MCRSEITVVGDVNKIRKHQKRKDQAAASPSNTSKIVEQSTLHDITPRV